MKQIQLSILPPMRHSTVPPTTQLKQMKQIQLSILPPMRHSTVPTTTLWSYPRTQPTYATKGVNYATSIKPAWPVK